MKKIKRITFIILASIFLVACSDKDEIDTIKPSIDLSIANAFPTSCDTLFFGEAFTVKMLLSDNVQLGAYNIDIHHNFDQHTHSTEVEPCTLNSIKTPVNPYIFIQDYAIPDGTSEYTTQLSLTIPSSGSSGLFDEGDYHFQIRLTDEAGWSTLKGFHVKILRR